VIGSLVTLGAQSQAPRRPRPSAAGDITTTRPAVPGVNGLVTAGHPLASMAGIRIVMAGGNAVDAAVAVGGVLTVTEPQMNSIGGNGFMTIFDKRSGAVVSVNMAGAAPKALKAADMTPETLNAGVTAGIVPGNLGGYLLALSRYGTMSVGEVFAPAIEYAEHGYPIDDSLVSAIEHAKPTLEKYPTSAKIFLPNGRVPRPGELFRMTDYAATLRKLVDAEKGALSKHASRSDAIAAAVDRFYRGDIAQEFDRFFRENHGVITAADLAAYSPTATEPVHTKYRGYDVYSSPPTSRGGLEVTMQANLVEGYSLKDHPADSAETLNLLAQAIEVAKSDIYRYVADPKFTKVPVPGLLAKDYADTRRKLLDPARAIPYPSAGSPAPSTTSDGPRKEGEDGRVPFPDAYDPNGDTTSFSIVDRFGNGVGCTPTLGGMFGSNVVVGDTGLLLNNGMRLGSTSPYPDNVNYVRGGQVPLLNNSPTVVLKDGRLAFIFGSPGGETIGQSEFQVLVHLIDYGMGIQEAIEAPRFVLNASPNFYKPGSQITMMVEQRVGAATLKALDAMGYHLDIAPDYAGGTGSIQGIKIDLETGTMKAGADPRRTGYAIGY
jgi:gamma-glutamyltranspeptidase / glutathione hydrolase